MKKQKHKAALWQGPVSENSSKFIRFDLKQKKTMLAKMISEFQFVSRFCFRNWTVGHLFSQRSRSLAYIVKYDILCLEGIY